MTKLFTASKRMKTTDTFAEKCQLRKVHGRKKEVHAYQQQKNRDIQKVELVGSSCPWLEDCRFELSPSLPLEILLIGLQSMLLLRYKLDMIIWRLGWQGYLCSIRTMNSNRSFRVLMTQFRVLTTLERTIWSILSIISKSDISIVSMLSACWAHHPFSMSLSMMNRWSLCHCKETYKK